MKGAADLVVGGGEDRARSAVGEKRGQGMGKVIMIGGSCEWGVGGALVSG